MFNRGSFGVCLLLPLLFINVPAQSRATVLAAGARLREKPGSHSAVLAPLEKGAEITVENAFLDDEWTLVSVDDKKGWVRREKIRISMDDPWKQAVWLYMGRTPETNGFVVRFYLNATQIIRRGDNIRFWTKMVPNNKKAYFGYVMDLQPERRPADFRFNSDLWEGDCRSKDVRLLRSILYWKSNELTKPRIARGDVDTSSNSAARAILNEACKAAER